MNDLSVKLACAEASRLIGLHHDGELAPLEAIRLERHLADCESCRTRARALAALSSALRDRSLAFEPPAGFATRLPGRAASRSRSFLPLAASLVAGSLLTLAGAKLFPRADRGGASIARDVVAAQIRATLPGHMTDVISSDQHTVKPWFSGRLDYSPPVVDLADAGFPLEGGRLDYAGGRTVAALVYRRRKHAINVFLWPSEGPSEETESSENGFHVLHWTLGGMTFWSVSDVDPSELRTFASLLRERIPAPPPA
jgi:anti-sigma factor RsiW